MLGLGESEKRLRKVRGSWTEPYWKVAEHKGLGS